MSDLCVSLLSYVDIIRRRRDRPWVQNQGFRSGRSDTQQHCQIHFSNCVRLCSLLRVSFCRISGRESSSSNCERFPRLDDFSVKLKSLVDYTCIFSCIEFGPIPSVFQKEIVNPVVAALPLARFKPAPFSSKRIRCIIR